MMIRGVSVEGEGEVRERCDKTELLRYDMPTEYI
jgi:hypothetical protein